MSKPICASVAGKTGRLTCSDSAKPAELQIILARATIGRWARPIKGIESCSRSEHRGRALCGKLQLPHRRELQISPFPLNIPLAVFDACSPLYLRPRCASMGWKTGAIWLAYWSKRAAPLLSILKTATAPTSSSACPRRLAAAAAICSTSAAFCCVALSISVTASPI